MMVRTAPPAPRCGAPDMKAEPAATPVEIEAAPARIADAIRPTPQIAPATLSDLAGAPVHLKHEHMRATGGFRLRGAGDAILQPDAGGRTRGDLVVPDRPGRTPVMGKFGSAGPADAGASFAEPVAAAGKTPRRRRDHHRRPDRGRRPGHRHRQLRPQARGRGRGWRGFHDLKEARSP